MADNKEIIGIEKDGYKNNDKFLLGINQALEKIFGKAVASKIKTRIEDYQAKKICIVECPKADEPIIIDHFADRKKKELFYVRSGPRTVALGIREYQKHVKATFQTDHDL